jgi:hypothetical protein
MNLSPTLQNVQNLAYKHRWYILVGLGLIIVWYLLKRRKKAFDPKNYPHITPEQGKMLANLNEGAKADLYEFINKANQLSGVEKIEITSGYRTHADQIRMTKKYSAVAAAVGLSPHQYGLGIDIVVTWKGKRLANSTGTIAEWKASGIPALAESLGLRWGGYFKKTDPVHFDVIKKYNLSTSKLREKGIKMFGSAEKTEGNKIPIT